LTAIAETARASHDTQRGRKPDASKDATGRLAASADCPLSYALRRTAG